MAARDEPSVEGLPKPGFYRHFKGAEYELLSVARHSETDEVLVVYVAVKDPDRIWVRPASMFTETVQLAEGARPRFEPAPPVAASSSRRRSLLRAFAGWLERIAGQIADAPEDRGHLHGSARRA